MSTLVGWWKGENNTLDSVSGNNFIWWHGTGNQYDFNGYTSGVLGSGISVDYGDQPAGQGFYILNSGYLNFSSSGEFSIQFDIKLSSDATKDKDFYVVLKNGAYVNNQADIDWGIRILNGNIKLVTHSGAIGSYQTTQFDSGGSLLYDDVWHNVLVSYASGYWRTYIDNIDVSINTGTQHFITNTLVYNYGFGVSYNGYIKIKFAIDEIKLFSTIEVPGEAVEENKFYGIVVNQRLSPYKASTNDKIQLKYNLYNDDKTRLSYIKNAALELKLNTNSGLFQVVNSGTTDNYGTHTFYHSCSDISGISNCLGYVTTTINDKVYDSNIVRFNFA